MEELCFIRDLYRSITEFETIFQQKHNLCLNEGMLLCSLRSHQYSSGEIADMLGLTYSNASKVIKAVEEKGFVKRVLGMKDKRQMYFSLSESGIEKLKQLESDKVETPILLKRTINRSMVTKRV